VTEPGKERPLAWAETPAGKLVDGIHVHDRLFYGRSAQDRPYAEVIGDPIAHSKSPLIHRFWIDKLGMTADYLATKVAPHELADYVGQRSADRKWRGCNVTMPLKVAVMDHVTLLADRAETPSVNTIFRHRFDVPVGTTTDMAGFWKPLERMIVARGFPIWEAPVQIVGAGGAARAVVAAFAKAGIRNIWIYNRTAAKAREVAALFGLDESRALPLDVLSPVSAQKQEGLVSPGPMIVVNASSLGMTNCPDLPIDAVSYPPGSLAYDLVYEPVETQFLRSAARHGFVTIDGLQMLVEQASLSFSMFFKKQPPREHDAELRALLTS